jgi:hypothetical protein
MEILIEMAGSLIISLLIGYGAAWAIVRAFVAIEKVWSLIEKWRV